MDLRMSTVGPIPSGQEECISWHPLLDSQSSNYKPGEPITSFSPRASHTNVGVDYQKGTSNATMFFS